MKKYLLTENHLKVKVRKKLVTKNKPEKIQKKEEEKTKTSAKKITPKKREREGIKYGNKKSRRKL